MVRPGDPDFRVIKAHVSILDVLQRKNIEVRGNQYQKTGKCPLPMHTTEDRDTFKVGLSRTHKQWVWSCHSSSCAAARGGKKGGDLIDFVRYLEGCPSLLEAGKVLVSWFGPFPGEVPESVPSPSAPVAVAKAVEEVRVNPPLSFELRDVDPCHEYLRYRGFEEEECEYLGVGYFPGKGMMRNRVVFPMHNAERELIGYAGRRVEYSPLSDDPAHVAPDAERTERWLFPAGFRRGDVLHNLHRVEGDWAIVVESFWGVLACIRAGIFNAVAITSNYATDIQVTQLSRFSRISVLLDGDEAGRTGAKNLVERLVNAGVESVEMKMLRDGVQPDHLKPDTLRACLGVPPEADGPLTIVEDHPYLRAVPAISTEM